MTGANTRGTTRTGRTRHLYSRLRMAWLKSKTKRTRLRGPSPIGMPMSPSRRWAGTATSPTPGSASTSSIRQTWSPPSSRRCARTSTACRRRHLRREASMRRSLSVDGSCLTGRVRVAMLAAPAPTTTAGRCTRLRKLASTARTRRARQTRRIAPRLCVRSGSTRRTSTTAAQRPSPTSSRITTGFVNSVSRRSSSATEFNI